MRLHCAFDDRPPRHWSEAHGYLCDGCWWYSDAALAKNRLPLTFVSLFGYCEPRTPPVPCVCCGSDNRVEVGGNGRHCGLCIDRGHDEDD